MGESTSLDSLEYTREEETISTKYSQSYLNTLLERKKSEQEASIIEQIVKQLEGKNRTAIVAEVEDFYARSALEAAMYGMGRFFNRPVSDKQLSIWNYEHFVGSSGWGGNNNLWSAANEYVSWGQPSSAGNGKYLTQDDPVNLTLTSEDANVNVNYNNASFEIGPFVISYNAGGVYGNISLTRNFKLKITDESGTQITNYKILDAAGNQLTQVPNGSNFFIGISYSEYEDIQKISLDAEVEYIDSVSGAATDYKMEVQEWEYRDFSENNIVKTTYTHSTRTEKVPVTVDVTDDEGNVIGTEEVEEEVYVCTVDPGGDDVIRNEWKATDDDWDCKWKGASIEYYVSTSVMAWLRIQEGKGNLTGEIQNPRLISESSNVTWDKKNGNTVSVTFDDDIMEIAGYVWEDGEQGKSSTFNGQKDARDEMLSGIEVRLYESNGNLAEVEGKNPVITGSDGYYEFKKVNATKKYYVMFTYDGMVYTNTYGAGKPEYNTAKWNASSKGSELVSQRKSLNARFSLISSDPKGYQVSSKIFSGSYLVNDKYNKVFDINSGKVQEYKAKITAQLKSYMNSNDRLGIGTEEYVRAIYNPIINSSSNKNEAKQYLQFIWDCRINSYAGQESEENGQTSINGLYPYKNKILLTNNQGQKYTSDKATEIYGYYIVYNGQLNINQGLIKRDHIHLEVTQDTVESLVSINEKDEVYKFGTLSEKQINLMTADYVKYTQNVVTHDYNYKIKNATITTNLNKTAEYPVAYAPIQLYVTYKIKITNESNIPTSIDEIVTYFDTKYFSYSDSYTTSEGKTLSGIKATFIENNIETELDVGVTTHTSSKYGAETENTVLGTDMYIRLGGDVILENKQSVAIYVTYRLGENSTKDSKFNCTYSRTQNAAYKILQQELPDEGETLEIGTLTEINGFKTFYKKTSDSSSTQNKYSYTNIRGYNYRPAGVLDSRSIPGNLTQNEIDTARQNASKSAGSRTKIELDWDSAATFAITNPPSATRSITGNVWETVGQNASVWYTSAQYAQYNSAYNVKGITVELIEIKNGKQYIRASTETDNNGKYTFDGIIPGNYTVRFIYGDKAKYGTAQHSPYTTTTIGNNTVNCAYNGQFYQSTKANPKTNDTQFWYANEENTRYSDAYDEVNIREKINKSFQEYKYEDIIKALKHPTQYMAYAYTSLIDIYPEKAKKQTISQNPGYIISNIDFGLTPRTQSDLEIKKEVSHVKLVLQSGIVQFDADTATIREQGVPGVVQAAQGYDINISMSSELVNGATLEITYTMTVKNNTPKDDLIYYRNSAGSNIAVALYGEDSSKLVYFEETIRTYQNNEFIRQADETYITDVNSHVGTTSLVVLDSNKTQIVEPTARAMAIADFIPNNLNFIKNDYTGRVVNEDWDLYNSEIDNSIWGALDGTKANLEEKYYRQYADADERSTPPEVLDMTEQAKEIYDSNSIVLTNSSNPLITTRLKTGESVSTEMVLSKVISVNSDSTDTKSYKNKARILKIYSSDSKIQDLVGTESEKVIISDPTGIGNKYILIVLTLVVSAIIGSGIVLIKKFVIPKN